MGLGMMLLAGWVGDRDNRGRGNGRRGAVNSCTHGYPIGGVAVRGVGWVGGPLLRLLTVDKGTVLVTTSHGPFVVPPPDHPPLVGAEAI